MKEIPTYTHSRSYTEGDESIWMYFILIFDGKSIRIKLFWIGVDMIQSMCDERGHEYI